MTHAWRWVRRLGISDEMPETEARYYEFTNTMMVVGIFVTSAFVPLFWASRDALAIGTIIAFLASYFVAFAIRARGHHWAATTFFVCGAMLHYALGATLVYGTVGGTHHYLILLGMGVYLLYPPKWVRTAHVAAAVASLSYVAILLGPEWEGAVSLGSLPAWAVNENFTLISLMVCFVAIGVYERRVVTASEAKLEKERARVQAAHAALHDAQSQLVQSRKMASLGRLVAGVAHDVNTPLAAISGTQQTLGRGVEKLRLALEKEHPESLTSRKVSRSLDALSGSADIIGEAAGRIDGVVTRLRSFARLDQASLQDVDVAQCVTDVLTVLEHTRPAGVDIETEIGELPKLRCYPADLNQLIMNIVVNALDATGDEGRVSITAGLGDELSLVIQDDGCGIAAEHLDEVFDPGFTTKGVGFGGGYGLAIAFRIAERHGGTIAIESEVDHGTSVTVRLPLEGPALDSERRLPGAIE